MTTVRARNVQLVGWTVLWASFAAFVLALVGTPWLATAYVRAATIPQRAAVACKSGSCALARGQGLPRVVRPDDEVPPVAEGYSVSTDTNSQALVRFFDGSTGNLDRNTTLTLQRMRRPRFLGDARPRELAVAVSEPTPGLTARLTAATTWENVTYVVHTPQGSVTLGPQTRARVEVGAGEVRVTGIEGQTVVANDRGEVTVGPDLLTVLASGGAPSAPSPGGENIVANSDFDRPVTNDDWRVRTVVPGGGADTGKSFAAILDGDRTAVRIQRHGSGGRSGDIVYEQLLGDQDVGAATSISVRVRLRVLAQSLPLGGMRGTEMPATVKLVGVTGDGTPVAWSVGFYTTRPDPSEPEAKYALLDTVANVELPLGEWQDFDSGNLLDAGNANGFAAFDLPAPLRLDRLEIIASGHDYESDIDAVEVWVK